MVNKNYCSSPKQIVKRSVAKTFVDINKVKLIKTKAEMKSLALFVSALSCVSLISGASVSQQEFNNAITSSGFRAPAADVYQGFASSIGDFSKEEAAMLLAQFIHESVGFRYIEELGCSNDRCRDRYKDKVGLPSKSYHGRGYIQLTWGSNYKKASNALGMGDRLLNNPEVVAQDKKIAMQVSIWYWNTRVRPLLNKYGKNLFGWTTRGINGGECTKYKDRAKKRWTIYTHVAQALSIANKAKENGCYN